MRTRRGRRRRGIVLLVVLSLLALFAVIAVTFIIVASQSGRAARAAARFASGGDDWRKTADMAMYQLLRDVPDADSSSSLRDQSLLADLYGHSGIRVSVVSSAVDAGGQFLRLVVQGIPGSPVAGYYNGRVVTLLTGRAAGRSSRVLDFSAVNAGTHLLTLEAFDSDLPAPQLPAAGDVALINDPPFNGTGFGFDPSTGRLDANLILPGTTPGQPRGWGATNLGDATQAGTGGDDIPIGGLAALFSHRTASTFVSSPPRLGTHAVRGSTGTALSIDVGGADESWDAVDFQNLFLADVPLDAAQRPMITPSFHRPSLVGYIFHRVRTTINALASLPELQQWTVFAQPYGPDNLRATSDDPAVISLAQRDFIVDLKRACIFRPLPEDHPNFTGSNPSFHYLGNLPNVITGQVGGPWEWDVDNDGDGRADSIWIDVGMPVARTREGKTYKPLVAILCRDLDSRLNLNAHDNLAHLPTGTNQFADAAGQIPPVIDNRFAGGPELPLKRNLGYGPADICLRPVFADVSEDKFAVEYTSAVQSRYRPATTMPLVPGRIEATGDELLDLIRLHGLPRNYAAARSAYASPSDLRGIGAIALDHAGNPVTVGMGMANETVDDPYELLLGNTFSGDAGGRDAPYKITELERLLRFWDADASTLPGRLIWTAPKTFLGSTMNGADSAVAVRRAAVTVHSSHIPVPNIQAAPEQRSHVGTPSPSILDLYLSKLAQGGAANPSGELRKIVPPELFKGELMNLNRQFGNGRDDNNNGVVDDTHESPYVNQRDDDGNGLVDDEPERYLAQSELAWPDAGYPIRFDHRNDDYYQVNPRQAFARHLYCLMMLLVDQSYVHPTLQAGAASAELTARRIAQWAVNVADFRDANAIMTPFEYDVNPFNGWSVDGWVGRNPGPDRRFGTLDDIDDSTHPERRLVWGCEAPDLLMTETVAFHDRRVKDTNFEVKADGSRGTDRKDPQDPDEDLDQYRIPQGSLFLEFYCPRNLTTNNPVVPGELYDPTTGQLDLGRLAPARPITRMVNGNPVTKAVPHPVWRVVITNPTVVAETPLVQAYVGTPPPGVDAATFEPDPTKIERVVFFSPVAALLNYDGMYPNFAVSDYPEWDRLFWGQSGTLAQPPTTSSQGYSYVLLQPNGYAVVGPRTLTHIGSTRRGPDNDPATHSASTHELRIINNTFEATDATNPLTNPYPANRATPPLTDIKPPLGVICAAAPPSSWKNRDYLDRPVNRMVGLNVSEPLPQGGHYYPEPWRYLPQDPGAPNPPAAMLLPDAYANPSQGWVNNPSDHTQHNACIDVPLDMDANCPLQGDVSTGTRLNFRSAYLQRLADPTLPWNPEPQDPAMGAQYYDPRLPVNPYVTVDWSAIDLTVFSGNEDTDRQFTPAGDPPPPAEWIDPNDQDPFNTAPDELFASRQRDGNGDAGTWGARNIWSPHTRAPAHHDYPASGNPDNYFRQQLVHTLGYLNEPFGPPQPLAFPYTGSPATPFPWLTWNNRPFSNALELMLVPASSPSRLLYEFVGPGVFDSAHPENTPFLPAPGEDPYDASGNNVSRFRAPFGHLFNFFHSASDGNAGHFYRIFDYVGTPSPFVGTEKWYNPAQMAAATAPPYGFRPPYNSLSRFRDPGRVNINTMPYYWMPGADRQWGSAGDDDGNGVPNDYFEAGWPGSDDVCVSPVWEGVAKAFREMDSAVDASLLGSLIRSREGLWRAGTGVIPNYPRNFAVPTRIANPFRTAASGDLMPLIADPNNSSNTQGLLRTTGVQATLLRSAPPPNTDRPLFAYASTALHNDTERNPYFRYQGFQHLGNLLTTHSNVFAVWITVGYFEVEPNLVPSGNVYVQQADAAHPDGYRLGQEVGIDTGDIKRHRAFYIIDRSIPVAFERGENHNVDRAILVRRFIE